MACHQSLSSCTGSRHCEATVSAWLGQSHTASRATNRDCHGIPRDAGYLAMTVLWVDSQDCRAGSPDTTWTVSPFDSAQGEVGGAQGEVGGAQGEVGTLRVRFRTRERLIASKRKNRSACHPRSNFEGATLHLTTA